MGRKTRANRRPVLAYYPATGELREYVSVFEAAKDFGVAYPVVLSALERVGGTVVGWQVFDEPGKIRERIEHLKKELYFVVDIVALKEALRSSGSDSIIKSKREQDHSVWDSLQQYYSRLGGKEEYQFETDNLVPEPNDKTNQDESPLEIEEIVDAVNSIDPECNEEVDDSESNIKLNIAFLQTKIEDCGFSVRATNCLHSAGINTVSELLSWKISDLSSIRHFGRKSLNEILLFKERNRKTIRGLMDRSPEELPLQESLAKEVDHYDFYFAMHSISLKATLRFYPKDKRFVLLAGSGICRQSTNSIKAAIVLLREKILSSPNLVTFISQDVANLNNDFEMPYASSDAAIQFCSGTARLGREAWISTDGQSFGRFSRELKKE